MSQLIDRLVAVENAIEQMTAGESSGDVTPTDIAAEIHAATGKTTPVDADETAITDSAASYALKKLTWANLKATLKTYFDTLYIIDLAALIHAATGKTTPVDADELGIADSAASYALKKLTWANLKATLKTYFDTLYNVAAAIHAATGKTTPDDADELGIADAAASYVLKKLTWANLKATLKTYFDSLYLSSDIAALVHAATNITTPVDNDETLLVDSTTGFRLAKLTWANLKATLKTYFDTLYIGSAVDAGKVSKLVASDGAPDPAWSADASGNLIPASTYDIGSTGSPTGNIYQNEVKDIYPIGDTIGLARRFSFWRGGTTAIEDDFTATSLGAAWAWAGSPFVTPSRANLTAFPSLLWLGHSSSQRSFLYRTDSISTSNASLIIGSPTNLPTSGYYGVRFDDGSDNNYVEAVILQGASSCTITSRYRTGGGAVTATNHQTLYDYPQFFVCGVYQTGTLYSNWTFWATISFLTAGPAFIIYSAASGLTWTPTRRGVVFFNNTTADWQGCLIDKFIRTSL